MPTQTFTVTGWIKTTVPSYDPYINRNGFAGSVATGWDVNRQYKTFELSVTRGDVYVWGRSCPDLATITSGRLVTPYQWHLLAAVCSPTNVSVYIDGRCATNRTVNCPLPVWQWLRIGGAASGSTSGFVLDDVRIYGRALDTAEIQSLYNEDTDGDGLPNWWMSTSLGHDTGQGSDRTLATDDYDGDGYTNLQEYQLRTRPNASYQHPADLPRNLVAWWKLDEGMGTNVFDSSLNGHYGFVMGGNPAGSWTTGVFSNAVTLGGPSNNWIQVPYHASLTPAQELTLAGWVKPFGQGILAGNWDSVGQVYGNYRLQFGPDSIELWFSPAGDGSYYDLHFNPNWSTNEWHHLAVCYGDNDLAVFVDGALMASRTVIGPLSPVPNPVLIGFPGLAEAYSVDDVRIYNRGLGPNEIAALSRGNGLPVDMIVGETATLHAFGASESDTCQWTVVSGAAFFTNTFNCTTDFRPSWSGAVTVQVAWASAGVVHTNRSRTAVAFPSLSPISDWNSYPTIQNNNCYNYATDIRTDTFAQPGTVAWSGWSQMNCEYITNLAISDGLQPVVDLDDLCHTSGLPEGHIVALLVWSWNDYHMLRMEADGTWSHKPGPYEASTLDDAGQPIRDPRTAYFTDASGTYRYVFCGFFWVGPDVHIQ